MLVVVEKENFQWEHVVASVPKTAWPIRYSASDPFQARMVSIF